MYTTFQKIRRRRKRQRMRERYQFLREHFGLQHEEAKVLTRELETWWRKQLGPQAR